MYQHEKETRDHIQGYLYLKKQARLAAMKKLLPRAHWEPRKGSHKQARAYCMKEETRTAGPFEWGDPPAQGKRTDVENIVKVRTAKYTRSLS